MPAAIADKRRSPPPPSAKDASKLVFLDAVLPAVAAAPDERLEREVAQLLKASKRGDALLLGLDRLRRFIVAGMPAASKRAAVAGPGRVLDKLPELIASGQIVPSSEFAQRLGWTRQALSKALRARRVFFLESGGERYYPAFFFEGIQERRHLEAVSKILADLPGGAKWLFFSTPKGSLSGRTPLQALARGELAAVKTSAEGYADR
jgi:hypothetical protein